MRSVSLLRYRCGIFFSLSPDPPSPALSNLLASACSPAPGRGRRGRLGFAAAGVAAICLLASFLCRSLAIARSLLPLGSSCVGELLARPAIFIVCLFIACVRMMRCRVLRPACLVGWRLIPRFLVPPSCPTDGERMAWCCRLLVCSYHRDCYGVFVLACGFLFLCRVRCCGVCGELDETARVPMIGWRRFSFSRHLVFDTG